MKLLPIPQKVEEQEGSFALDYCTRIIVDTKCSGAVYLYAQQLQDTIAKWCGVKAAIVRGKAADGDILLREDAQTQEGRYELAVTGSRICITAGNEELLLNGIQTLRQMLAQNGCLLPCVRIEDYPEIPVRGFYHDVTRGRVPKLEELKKLADTMCYYKMNQLQLYVEHTYLFRDMPELWRDETPLTAQDIMELEAYCQARHIDLVPSLSSFGHLYKLLRTKTCEEYCEMEEPGEEAFSFWHRMAHHTVNVSHEHALELIKGMIGEYLELFSSPYFNLCADETFDLCKGRSASLLEQKELHAVYTEYVGELCRFLVEKGKIPMFWGDILNREPERMKELPPETICLNWGYAAKQSGDSVCQISALGVRQYTCPGVGGWNEWVNLFENSYENIRRMCTYAVENHCQGVLNTDWGDFGHINQPEFSRPGMIYGASFAWNSRIPSFEDVNEAVSVLEFDDPTGQLMKPLAKLASYSTFDWREVVKFYETTYLKDTPEKVDRKAIICDGLERVQENIRNLAQIRMQVQSAFARADSSRRYLLQKYLLGIDAMLVWARVKPLAAKHFYGVGEQTESGAAVAAALENWFMHYKEEWRSVSREGDLGHLSDIVFWYADMCRGEKN